MSYDDYACLSVHVNRCVAFVTFDHPPRNSLDSSLWPEIVRLQQELESDPEVRVVVFQSANDTWFLGGADVTGLILKQPQKMFPDWHDALERLRTMPKATIGKVEGRAQGGGSEFLLTLDMRFGALGHAVIQQSELPRGIIPGGGATQRLPRLVGRGRALEIVLGSQDISAQQGEIYGYLNRALPAQDLTPFVEQLAYRIASFSATAIALAKEAVEAAELPMKEGLIKEASLFYRSLTTDEARESYRQV
jgi:enoyl-CoA hydratase/carnithine racemase